MKTKNSHINAVPTNIITGFLGVGKTTAILHLLKHKPHHERWAVLVNEFGEIGIDGSLFRGQHNNNEDIYIREVPGGCMCCTSGLPMQVALNQLLAKANPDRLLIEPTGLGHPQEVLQTLSSGQYRETLSLQKTLTLVDARKLFDIRYTTHDTFNQQIMIADTVIGNKVDLYSEEDKNILKEYVIQLGLTDTEILYTQHGKIPYSALQGPLTTEPQQTHHHRHKTVSIKDETPIPECGFIMAVNKGERFNSIGWRFSPYKVFNRKKLFLFLSGLSVERMKAVFITEEGVCAYNLTQDALTEMRLTETHESRIEIISEKIDDNWESQLLNCQ